MFVIPPGQVKNLRSRYGSAGNKDDRFDAYVLADVVRTDARRLRPMERDSDQTTALRSTVRARRDLVGHRVAAANQLRAHLQIVFPAAAALFADIDSEITLAFLSRFTTQEQADWLSPQRLAAWLKSVAYSGRTDPAVLHARLLAAPRGKAGPHAGAHAGVTLALVAVLRALNTQIQALAASIGAQLAAHPDAAIFHVPAPLRHRPRGPAARRDRRRPRPLPHPRLPDLPGRRRPLHPAVRQGQGRHLPVGSRQAAPRRPVRLRRQTPAGPAPGPPTSTTRPSPAAATTPTPSASSPAPGHTSSGAAGKTTPPTTPPPTTASRRSSTNISQSLPDEEGVDTGQLMADPEGNEFDLGKAL